MCGHLRLTMLDDFLFCLWLATYSWQKLSATGNFKTILTVPVSVGFKTNVSMVRTVHILP